jgi:hypothetical protein
VRFFFGASLSPEPIGASGCLLTPGKKRTRSRKRKSASSSSSTNATNEKPNHPRVVKEEQGSEKPKKEDPTLLSLR